MKLNRSLPCRSTVLYPTFQRYFTPKHTAHAPITVDRTHLTRVDVDLILGHARKETEQCSIDTQNSRLILSESHSVRFYKLRRNGPTALITFPCFPRGSNPSRHWDRSWQEYRGGVGKNEVVWWKFCEFGTLFFRYKLTGLIVESLLWVCYVKEIVLLE